MLFRGKRQSFESCKGVYNSPRTFGATVMKAQPASSRTRQRGINLSKISGRQVEVTTLTFKPAKEPRLRFDKTAIGLVRRLQSALAKSVPDRQTVIMTITAPIRQDSKTGAVLENRLRELLATSREQLTAAIHGNRIRVCVVNGGASKTSRFIGFVHNPEPKPRVLFDVTRSLLACIEMDESRRGRGDRWLVIADPDGRAPVKTIRQVCLALRVRTVFKRILVMRGERVRVV